jgi:glycerophosphoryl diester phosphodiesterase
VEMPDGILSPLHPAVLASAAAAKLPRSGGVEGMDLGGDGKTLVVLLEGQVAGDAPRSRRILRFDTTTRQWNPAALSYLLDENVANIGELARIEGDRFVIVERDSLAGDAARIKKVYAIDLARATPAKPLAKKLVIDLLALGNPRGLVEGVPVEGAALRFPYECTESIQVLDRQHVVVVNDNNYPATGGRGAGVRDVTEWLWLELANPL